MKIHIFFNRPALTQSKLWGEYESPDEYKLAFAAGLSWRAKGFQPVFIRSTDVSPKYRLPTFTGQLKPTLSWWNMDMMQLWGRCADLLENSDQWLTIACTDVLNQRISPKDISIEIANAKLAGSHCVNWTEIHVSCAMLTFNFEFARLAMQCLADYDYGLLPLIEGNQVSDETVIRTYLHKTIRQAQHGVKYAMAQSLWEHADAIHVSRSVLHHINNHIPTV